MKTGNKWSLKLESRGKCATKVLKCHGNLLLVLCMDPVLYTYALLMFKYVLAKKKKKAEKSKDSSADAASSLPLTEGMGQPVQGQLLDEEMIMMTGNSNIPPPSSVVENSDLQPTGVDTSDSSKSKRDDL